ncbi:hypothetical protein ABPG72_020047 [Tetrahymena utriculariae]
MNRRSRNNFLTNQQMLSRASANAVFLKVKRYMPNLASNVYLEDATSDTIPFRFCYRVYRNGRRRYISSVQCQFRERFQGFRLLSRLEKYQTVVFSLLLLKPHLYNSRVAALELILLMNYLGYW